jgi:uncharacterized protein (DUF927 family)
MTIVDTRKIFDKVKREAEAAAENDDGFTMDPAKGLTVEVTKGSGKNERVETLCLSAPFEILGRVRDPKSESWARLLRWKDDDKREHEYPVSDSDLHGDVTALCATLAARGLKITTGPNRNYLVQYLNSRKNKDRITIVPRTGWHIVDDKKVFALPGEGVGIDGRVILATEVTASNYATAGSLEGWQSSVGSLAQAHSRARLAIASAFVSPLLMLTDSDSGGINLRGPSTIGKTTLLSAAASVWGRGDERGFIRTWRGTGNGIEAAATQNSDTFLALDEIGVASGREVGNVVYSIAGGVGKQRANRDGSAKVPNTWRIFALSTGEISITDKIREGGERARAGQEVRILDIPADAGKGLGVFDVGDDPEQLARELRQAAVTCYGTAGPAFVKAILATADDVAIIARESLDAFREQVAGGTQSGQVLRAANRIGLIAAAGEMAIQLGILPWPTGSINAAAVEAFQAWHAERGGNDPAEVRAAIEQIGVLLEQHGDSRFDLVDRGLDTKPVPNRLGYVRGTGDDKQWLVLPNTWRDVLCTGFDFKMIAAALIERGLLLPGDGGKASRPEWIDGKTVRAYVLPAKAWGERGVR